MKMKKYLMMGAAAITISAAFVSCSNEIEPLSQEELQQYEIQKIKSNYEKAFVKVFGKANNRDNWGFSDANARTRTIAVNGDYYDKFPSADEIDANFPTAIPEDADEVADLENLYKNKTFQTQSGQQTMWGLWQIYNFLIVEGYNLKITQAGVTELGGSCNNASYDAATNSTVAHPYNVYVKVDGDVTIKRNGSTHFNLYVLQGNVTLESDYGEQAGIISVAQGATVNDQRNSIAANQGVKIFNRGTFNATNPQKYDIGNFCTFYNEGKFTATGALTYSPGMANTSYFMNLGDEAEVTAPAMTLNSAGNFFNSGKVTIEGETNVTQKDIYWVNAGHYTTGSIKFSAWNKTFYNYCQLIVKGQAYMHDGEFNLMENSYTEVGSAEMGNFVVNMGSNTGMYIKGDIRLLGQGDATYQGFRTEGTNDYLLIDGKATVDCHKNTFSISSGITYSINKIEIVRGGSVVTEKQLQDEQSGDLPVLNLNGTKCPYGSLTVTPNTNSCGATWNGGGSSADLRVMAEDLSAGENGDDFDFNDVVFDVYFSPNEGEAYVMVQAAGGTLPLKVHGTEVHQLFGQSTDVMINTHAEDIGLKGISGLSAQKIQLTGITINSKTDANQKIKIEVQKPTTVNGETKQQWIELENTGIAACKIGVNPSTITWANERVSVTSVCTFNQWVTGEGTLEPTHP